MDRFSEDRFHDENAARAYLEAVLWPDGPVCPHCGVIGHSYATKRPGVYRCAEAECRKDFTVTMKTVMERSKIKLHKWLQAFHLMCSSKKGVSAHQLHRTLDIGYEAAWFLCHRIREAMRTGGLSPMGGSGSVVEADETFIGELDTHRRRKGTKRGRGTHHKRKVLALVERGGEVRSFHIERLDAPTIGGIVRANIKKESILSTDEARYYRRLGKEFAQHVHVEHNADEYVKGIAHTNTLEGYFSIFKRGMKGVYQHCGEKHLHRYLAEFDFRYNARAALGVSDEMRAGRALKGISGKRLTYRNPDGASAN